LTVWHADSRAAIETTHATRKLSIRFVMF